jgi:hypothetical protein
MTDLPTQDELLAGLTSDQLDRIEAALDALIKERARAAWEARQDAFDAFVRARWRVTDSFNFIASGGLRLSHEWRYRMRRRWWFINSVSGMVVREQRIARPRAPFGWIVEREPDRDAWSVGPVWIMLPRRLWLRRYNMLFGPLVRLGFWAIKGGDYYVNGRWTWAWWRTLDERWTRNTPYYTDLDGPAKRFVPRSRWERFGWWIQRQLADLRATYPQSGWDT